MIGVEGGVFFFFSSRRRHTRFDCDWSSDVCSSDLFEARGIYTPSTTSAFPGASKSATHLVASAGLAFFQPDAARRAGDADEIGRAAWRGRGEISGGAVSFKKKKKRRYVGHDNHIEK